MTDKQKNAILFINELKYDRKAITFEEYFLLMEFIVGNNEPQITYIPFTQTDPKPLDPIYRPIYRKVETILTRKEDGQ